MEYHDNCYICGEQMDENAVIAIDSESGSMACEEHTSREVREARARFGHPDAPNMWEQVA
jgi:hypothetical protein